MTEAQPGQAKETKDRQFTLLGASMAGIWGTKWGKSIESCAAP